MKNCGCRIKFYKWPRVHHAERIAGTICILIAILIMLLCAPSWLIALIAAGLLFSFGAWLLFGQGYGGKWP